MDDNGTIVFSCATCGLPLTRSLRELLDLSLLAYADKADHVPVGFYTIADADFRTQFEGEVVINLKDSVNTKHTDDLRRLNGCCGLDGDDGMNTLCVNGHEVGTECSDCWMPHGLVLHKKCVTMNCG